MKKVLFILFLFSFSFSMSSKSSLERDIELANIYLPDKKSFLTEEELNWLNDHPLIRIAPDPNFAPFEYIDENKKYQGIGADYLRVIERMLEIKFQVLIYSNWSDIIADFKEKKIDLLNTVVSNNIRNEYMLFPSPYLFIPSVIIGRKGEIKKISLDNLGKYRIVMVRDYGLTGYFLEKYKGYKTILVNKNIDALELLTSKTVDVFISDVATAEYYMKKGGFINLEIVGIFKPDSIMGFGVRKDWKIFKNILEKAQKNISPTIYNAILNKWIKIDLYNKKILNRILIISLISFSGISLVIIFLLLLNRRLNDLVKKRTFQLNIELERSRQLEYELKNQNELLDTILNELPVPVLIINNKLEVIRTNHALNSYLNITEKEMQKFGSNVFKRIREIFDEETTNHIEENLKRFIADEKIEYVKEELVPLKFKKAEEKTCNFAAKKLGSLILFTFFDLTEIIKLKKELENSLKEKELLIKEIHHRVKNNFNIVISLLNLQKNKSGDKSIKEALTISQNRIYSMALIHEMLYQTNQYTKVNFSIYIEKLINHLKGIYPEITERIKFDISIKEQIELIMDMAIPLGMIINEIITNSLKYAFPDNLTGIIKIHLSTNQNTLILEIGDNGIGVKDKNDLLKQSSLGITIINSLIYQLKGEIKIKEGKGLVYLITIPLKLPE